MSIKSKNILSERVTRYAPAGLLGLAFVLHGAKTEIEFAIWGITSLVYSAWIFLHHSEIIDKDFIGCAVIYLFGLLIVQLFSNDRSSSLFWTLQSITFVLLWIVLRINKSNKTTPPALGPAIIFRIAGIWSAALTIGPLIHGNNAWGWLPFNPDWNYTWMAAISVFLAARWLFLSEIGFWKHADGLIAILLMALIVLGPSRSALVGVGIGLGWVIHERYRMGRRTLLFVVGIASLGFLPTPWFPSRLHETLRNLHQGGRIEIWKISILALQDHPMFGFGLGNFELAYLKHALPILQNPVHYDIDTAFAHNDYLQLLVDVGWPLGGWLLWGLMGILRSFFTTLDRRSAAAKASFLTLASTALFTFTFHLPLLFLMALLLTSEVIPQTTEATFTICQSHWLRKGLVFVALVTALGLTSQGVRASLVAHQQWDRIVKFRPTDAEAWHQLGNNQDLKKSIESQKRAVALSPNQPYYQESLGRLLESTQSTSETAGALQAYLNATLQAPKRAINYLAVGRLLFREGDPGLALPWFEKARALEPFYWESDLWRSRCYFAAGNASRAVSILNGMLFRHAVFMRHFAVRFHYSLSDYEQAILAYNPYIVMRQRDLFLSKNAPLQKTHG